MLLSDTPCWSSFVVMYTGWSLHCAPILTVPVQCLGSDWPSGKLSSGEAVMFVRTSYDRSMMGVCG